MKFPAMYVFLALLSAEANAAIYSCRSIMGATESSVHLVDTESHLRYTWLFWKYPNAQPACGTKIHSDRLTCELKSVFEDSVKIYASAEIQVGDRILRLASPDCGEGVACQIDCYLQNGSAREGLGH